LKPEQKALPRPGQHHRANVVVGLGLVERIKRLLHTFQVQRIAVLRQVECDRRDGVAHVVFDAFVGLGRHPALLRD
jgi:hypothetical protein